MINALNTKKDSIVDLVHDFSLNSNILVGQKVNAERTSMQTDTFQLFGIKHEPSKIDRSSILNEFQNIDV